MASTIDLQITQGNDFNATLVVYDDFGAIVNLTDYVVRGLVKNKYGDSGALFDLAPVVVDAAKGEVGISLPPSATKDFPVGKFHFGIEVQKGDIAFKPSTGNILVLPEVNS